MQVFQASDFLSRGAFEWIGEVAAKKDCLSYLVRSVAPRVNYSHLLLLLLLLLLRVPVRVLLLLQVLLRVLLWVLLLTCCCCCCGGWLHCRDLQRVQQLLQQHSSSSSSSGSRSLNGLGFKGLRVSWGVCAGVGP